MNTPLELILHHLGASKKDIENTLINAELLDLPTRHVLLHQGEIPSHGFFLLNGICHACYLTAEGKQFSKEFYWDQDVMIGFESLIGNEPSPFLLETLSASQLLAIPMSLIHQWRNENNPLYIRLIERQLRYKEQKERFMLIHTPEARYQLFTEHFAELLPRLADYQIASYLGITPTSLSRIKQRMGATE